jgi:pyridoxamine 5'-phosphate oxidase
MSSDAFIGKSTQYIRGELNETDLQRSPIETLREWIGDAEQAGAIEANAMCLSTVSADGKPSARFLLLRNLDERGLVFFTNYQSRKAQDIEATGHACATFWWGETERQVRVEGAVVRLSPEESDAYFYSRPFESRLASSASPQSQPIDSREELIARIEKLRQDVGTQLVRPAHWGGYLLVPDTFEFWQGRPSRIHDRFRMTKSPAGDWTIVRLGP